MLVLQEISFYRIPGSFANHITSGNGYLGVCYLYIVAYIVIFGVFWFFGMVGYAMDPCWHAM